MVINNHELEQKKKHTIAIYPSVHGEQEKKEERGRGRWCLVDNIMKKRGEGEEEGGKVNGRTCAG